MSKFSGKCDLYDHIMMMKQYASEANQNVLVSDELECFEAFKEATGGVIYQSQRVEVTEYNQNLICELCDYFHFHEPTTLRNGKKKYRYVYLGKEMSLKDINKAGVYINIPIHFNTLLDIIPYYPYIITCLISNNGKQHITISSKSYVETQRDEYITYGHMPCINYNQTLQEHYIEIVNRYFNPEGRKVTKTFKIKRDTDLENFKLWEALDYNWEIEVVRDRHSWIYSSPKIIDADNGIIDISKVWPGEKFDSITLIYVKKAERKLYLE